jgi:hypothetical protein
MGEGLKRARNAARATRGLPPHPVHLNRADYPGFTKCGNGGPGSGVEVTDDPAGATCKNCLRVQRGIDRDREAAELARQSLYKAD